jgi:hypothetical protein
MQWFAAFSGRFSHKAPPRRSKIRLVEPSRGGM